MKKKPLIGISLDCVDPNQQPDGNWYAKIFWYALRHKYVDAIIHAGGVPLALPYAMDSVQDYCDILDGLVITGGGCDVDPTIYGAEMVHPTVFVRPKRCAFEMVLTQQFLKTNKPFLGICGGMQVLAVATGGTLHQHLPEHAPSSIEHVQSHRREEPQHAVCIEPESLCASWTPDRTIPVNSVHHQGVATLGPSVRVAGRALDDLIEIIEVENHPFAIGVQWHPEFHVSPFDVRIFNEFILKASE